jgi:transcriptional regulator with XRE-family HTH domain
MREQMKKDDNNGSEELASFLKSKRLATGLSQGTIAKKFGYTSPQFISNWERALCMPPIHILEKLAQIFSSDPLELKEEVLQIELKQLEAKLRAKFFPLPSTISHIPTSGKNIGSSLSKTPLERRFEYLKFQINE